MRKNKTGRSGLKIMAKLISLVGDMAYVIVLAVINGSVGHILASFIPILGAMGIAKFLGAAVNVSYAVLFALIIGFGLLRGALKYAEQYSNHYIAFKLLAELRDKIFSKLRVLCPAKLETKQKGGIISMITADIETIEVFYAHTISPVCIAFFVLLSVFLFIGFVVSWIMAAFAAVSYVVIGVLLPYISSRFVSVPGKQYRAKFTKFNGYFMDAIKGGKEIVMHGGESARIQTVNAYSNELLSSTKKLREKSTAFQAVTAFTVVALNLIMLVIGILLSVNGMLPVSLMLVGVVALMSSYGPVLAVNALPNNLSQTFASGDRLLNLLEEEPAVTDVENEADFKFENLKTENLTFSYDKKNKVLDGVNIEVNKNEIVGIMGESGCGKSTLLKMLLRFWEKDGGEILYNGVDIDKINTASLKNNVTMVSQSTYIFDGSIKDNILIAKENASDKEIESACAKAGIHEFISQLKNGYNTKIGASGVSFSAGETQRVGLARAFLSDAKLILLDEPTSNVDAINEGIILKSLVMNKSGRAIVLVSHRESTMSIADRVYRFSNGKAEAQEKNNG